MCFSNVKSKEAQLRRGKGEATPAHNQRQGKGVASPHHPQLYVSTTLLNIDLIAALPRYSLYELRKIYKKVYS